MMRCRRREEICLPILLLLLLLVLVVDVVRAYLSIQPLHHVRGLGRLRTFRTENLWLSTSGTSSPPARHPKESKTRKESPNRRPRYYWTKVSNVESELRELWASKHVDIEPLYPPPIPNESLLNYWNRHDLRGAIATHGGRDFLSESLGGAFIIPGKWTEAVQTLPVQELLQQDGQLSSKVPPLSPQQQIQQQQKQQPTRGEEREKELPTRWSHSSHRKPKGYWSSLTVVVKEIYQFLEDRRRSENIPESWMPRLSELEQAGRNDLAKAIQRFGGTQVVCNAAGLIPFREWNYVEGMYEMLLGLKEYLDEYHDGDYKRFPVASHLKDRGKDRLYFLVQYYGGVKFLAARLDMECIGTKNVRRKNNSQLLSADMSWGPFDLEFAIDLYSICREQQLKKKPPLVIPEIRIPTRRELLEYGGERGMVMAEKIQLYGGYENVARRLGLGFSYGLF